MIRSMFTAINGLLTQQNYMDVIADNLANVNTQGFKSSGVTFKDQFAQLVQSGAAPNASLGGQNPIQIGLGTNIGSVTQTFSQGALQSTGRDLDLAVQGDGFFVYQQDTAQYYSRDGSIGIDAQGFLVNIASGDQIMGWQADGTGAIDTGSPLEGIQIPVDATVARESSEAYMLGNLDAKTVVGGTYNVTVGAYDSLGVLRSVTLVFEKTTDNDWTWAAQGDVVATGTLTGAVEFNSEGQFINPDLPLDYAPTSVSISGSPGADDFDVDINLSGLTMLSATNTATMGSQDGLAAGSLSGFNVSATTGEIFGVYSNGEQRPLGQLAMALFVNPSGLLRQGNNRYSVGLNSGEARISAAGSGGRGTIAAGYTEGSNVDMSREFANMIMAQRGFQANSRVITTSDEMLQELVNIKR
ncbi:MAG: flagellar hook protein FlgE [Anaerolineaceae bacterium]|nr:flagellar hook protein FlgE [Anaerolineaceae bacterium]